MTLKDLLTPAPGQTPPPPVTLDAVQRHLAALPGDEQVRQATDLDRHHHALLWRLTEAVPPGQEVQESDLVPPETPPLQPVPFAGQNNQPLYRPFQKVFYRTTGGEVAGYNVSDAAWFAGPGYYLVRSGPAGLFIDYTTVPDERPEGWPQIKRNESGLSRFVYGFMQDYLRRVHGLIFIGRAFRRGQPTNNYFVLARPPR